MKFDLTGDQRDFAGSLESLLSAADTIGAARSWGEGEHAAGLTLWTRLAEQGLTMLATEATPVEVCLAFEALGRHAVPGPWVESAAYLPIALGAEVDGVATLAVPPLVPLALDADVADAVYLVEDGALHVAEVTGDPRRSVDLARRLSPVRAGAPVPADGDLDAAHRLAVLATAAQLLGAGERVLADTVTYVKQRKQFGREIGSYQALKHQLADVKIVLDFARPLIYGAALDPTDRDVSAAKIAASEAAYRASRVGLQLHGAIGYTQEFDLSLWITKIRALVGAWGSPSHHRAVVLAALLDERAGGAA
ncbi:acyl-CoA dehydrogenase family protein [Nocardioides sp. R-C-SC26]|uniref:acyl-CoA dehydrogenase family protein n=1 Tax=Nocardioides sp. R-C-SC26 TaxID=2870414 RepID=UPI001E46B509|nr:acyl-CoA dehydrogenase family protein [Nocardioides sp. R-C-SC26]